MNIKILCFGKLDQKAFQQIYEMYAQKINKQNHLEVIELKEYYQAELKVNLMQNSKLIEDKLKKYSDYEIIFLDVNAKIVDSLEISQILENNLNFKGGQILFVIGPSDGFSQEIKQKYQTISFGKITFPHQLFRIVLVEQIYRGLKIMNHETYHK